MEPLMLLLSWNVRFRKPCFRVEENRSLIENIESARPDIVTLQEVKLDFADGWAVELKKSGLRHHYRSGYDAHEKSYQCLIASRWQVKPDDIGWRRNAPFPELLGRATVSVRDEGDIDVFTAHIPNGEGHGWKKIDTFHVLSAELRQANDSPRILTGDFNEPRLFQRSGRIETFGEGTYGVGGTCTGTYCDEDGDERPLIEWTNGVLSVLGGVSHHGLRDAYRDRHGFETPPLIHIARAQTHDVSTIPSSQDISMFSSATTTMNGASRD